MRIPPPVIALLALVTAACAGAPHAVGPAATRDSSYQLGVGDHLRIDVYNEPKLSGEFVVAGDGTIAYPLLGRVAVGGQTLAGLSDMLTRTLTGGVLLHPSVAVQMISFRPVFILGEVEKPGQYPYIEHMTVYTLVAQAGGFTYRASRREIGLRRDGETSETKVKVGSATAINPGDTVRILERYF